MIVNYILYFKLIKITKLFDNMYIYYCNKYIYYYNKYIFMYIYVYE